MRWFVLLLVSGTAVAQPSSLEPGRPSVPASAPSIPPIGRPSAAPIQPPGAIDALEAQRASVALQQAAVYKQVVKPAASTHTFFSVPWTNPTPPTAIAANAAFAAAPASVGWRPSTDCDPVSGDEADALIREHAQKQNLAPELLRAVIAKESAFYPCAVSPKGALGLMQLMPGTAQELGVADPMDPSQNVDGGARLLKQLIGRYGGDLALALSAYNAGPARVDASAGIPPIKETQNYVSDILGTVKPASGTQ